MPVRVMLSYGTEGKAASDTEGNNGQGREALTATVVVLQVVESPVVKERFRVLILASIRAGVAAAREPARVAVYAGLAANFPQIFPQKPIAGTHKPSACNLFVRVRIPPLNRTLSATRAPVLDRFFSA
jgi:hypothetical protein